MKSRNHRDIVEIMTSASEATTTEAKLSIMKCHDCNALFTNDDLKICTSVDENLTQGISRNKKGGEGTNCWWWCRDCMATVCSVCHLMKGHTEHRSGRWVRQELYRSTMQGLEGRCSARSSLAKEFEVQIREFTAALECHLVDLLRKRLEELNEPDRLLISRLSRALHKLEGNDSPMLNRSLYHILSPSAPAHQVWTLCTKDPERATLPCAWSVVDCAKYLIEKQETAEDILCERRARHFGSCRDVKNGCSQMKSGSVMLGRSTSSLPPFISQNYISNCSQTDSSSLDIRKSSELAKEKCSSNMTSNGPLSADNSRTQIPLEPSVLVREMKQQLFRKSSFTDESDSACALKEETFNSTSPSATSSIPVCQTDSSYDSHDLQVPLCEQTISSCNPTTSSTVTLGNLSNEPSFMRFGERLFSRPIDIVSLPNIFTREQLLAVSDSCGGVYVVTCKGVVLQHLPTRDCSASSLAIDPTSWHLLVSVMHSQGRSIHVFDIKNSFKRVEVIPCPKEPKIELSRTRWITVSPRGELFAVSGDNQRSAIWMYNQSRKGWKVLKESRKTRYQYLRVAEDQAEYKAVVLLTCDAAQNLILLFVVDHTGTLINEYDLTKTYKLYECIKNPASAIVDSLGNLLVVDYSTSRLWALLSSTKGMRHLKEIVLPISLDPQEVLGITAHGDWIYMTCFARREVICLRYLMNGVLTSSCYTTTLKTPMSNRNTVSPPRPTRKPNQV